MTQIPTFPTASGSDALLYHLKDQSAVESENKPANTPLDTADTPASAKDPATVVDLSREAQDILALKTDQEVADRLQEVLTSKKKDAGESGNSDAADKLFGIEDTTSADPNDFNRLQALKEAARNRFQGHNFDALIAEHEKVTAGGFGSMAGLDDPKADFVQDVLYDLAWEFEALRTQDKTEEAQKLDDAVVNGTLQIGNNDVINGLNMSYDKTVTRTEIGTNRSFKLQQNPVGDVKAALDANLAKTHGFGDDGAFYFNWEGKDPDTESATPASGT